ncbi:SDR family oxidoreductase [Hwanghaeella grinnelliae]|uniref:SDR family oxidoreductase n=1 Tax=Hwanghaeella grinnelliae TaxID=2500179 RepID=A0A437QX59_9PROT|nr:SDR family oxidoreductase [Hwanghaeella grinnelliae]RVU39120.1 SDR family oxidoreductase [Hwanghaeella grinnelliae]
MTTELSNKTILVTGASRGIGEATARHFAAEGANVVMMARSAARLEEIEVEIRAGGGAVTVCTGDVSAYGDVAAAVDGAVKEYGGLDVLVNNAGVIDPIARLADSDPTEWDKVVDINVKGVYHGLRAAIPAMLESGGGTVINISSGAATNALEGWSHYCCTKAAVLSLTACADKEYGSQGIRVVGLSPGTVATEMQVSIKASGINPVSQLDPSVHIPTEWVAKAAAYLVGDGGAAYAGRDFSIKTDEGRKAVGLPAVS